MSGSRVLLLATKLYCILSLLVTLWRPKQGLQDPEDFDSGPRLGARSQPNENKLVPTLVHAKLCNYQSLHMYDTYSEHGHKCQSVSRQNMTENAFLQESPVCQALKYGFIDLDCQRIQWLRSLLIVCNVHIYCFCFFNMYNIVEA